LFHEKWIKTTVIFDRFKSVKESIDQMNPNEILRIVDSLHRDKNIATEIVFKAIESGFASAAKRQYGETAEVVVTVDRENGELSATLDDAELDPEEMVGRIGAQMAKQVIIQKLREAERDSQIEEFQELIDEIVNGTVHRVDGPMVTVNLNNVEAILPRSEQIPGESHRSGERICAMVCEVRPQGTRVKVVLSRTRPRFVQRLFEQEIPEIADGVITVNALAREPGYRSKVAVSSSDSRVDCVGACVGVRGNRIRVIVDELNGERIDIVRYDEDPEVLIPNALQPAEVDQVLLCDMIGRAIVLVSDDQLSLAIGRRGQNVRLASKLCGWDIEIMTADELEQQIERAVTGFSALDGMTDELAAALVEQGYLSYDDLSVIEPDAMAEMGEMTLEQVNHIVVQAEARAEEAEVAAREERQKQKGLARVAETEEAPAAAEEAPAETEEAPAETEEAPAETEEAPAEAEEAPAETEEAPAETEEAPAETEEVPAETEEVPAETEEVPAETEEVPAETEEAPAETEEADE
jgi:N utilization substance protein A